MAFKGHHCSSSQDTFGFSLLSYVQEQDKIMLQSGLLVPIQELNFISCPGGCFPQVQMGLELSLQEESGKVAPPSEPLPPGQRLPLPAWTSWGQAGSEKRWCSRSIGHHLCVAGPVRVGGPPSSATRRGPGLGGNGRRADFYCKIGRGFK